MTKRIKRKKKKRRRTADSNNGGARMGDPQAFFRRIGIRPQGSGEGKFSDPEAVTGIRNLGKSELIEGFWKAREAGDEEEFYHSDVDLVKIRYGFDFKRICKIAAELKKVPVPPQSRVLDVGGGPGHLAFWMVANWEGCSVTVADQYSHLGTKWASEISEDRVKFVDAMLPNLSPLKGQQFDIVVLSRVLSVILHESLPSSVDTFSTGSYFKSAKGKRLLDELDGFLEGVARVLAPEGSVIVVESWSYTRILVIAQAFREKGLFINLDLFSPDQVSKDYSLVVFSKFPAQSHIQDIPLALATRIDMGDKVHMYEGLAAESIRKVFGGVAPRMVLEYASGDERGSVRNEVLEREGLALVYRTFTTGVRKAFLSSATEIPRLIEGFQKMEKVLVAEKDGTTIRMFIANDLKKGNDVPNQMAGTRS